MVFIVTVKKRKTWSVEKDGYIPCSLSIMFQGSAQSPPSNKMSHSVSPSGKPLVKTSREMVLNTEEPAITVDVGSTIKTVQGVNVTINCQVAGKRSIHLFIHLFRY